MKLNQARALTAAATVVAPVSWGTTYVITSELLPDGRPLLVSAIRVVPAGVVLLGVGAFTSRWRPRGTGWLSIATLATFNFVLFFPLLAVAVYRLPGGVAAAAGGLQPLLVAGVTAAANRGRPSGRDLWIGATAAAGVGLVVIRPDAHFDPVGLFAALGANASFAIGVVLTKRFPPAPNRLAATGWQLLLAGAVLVPLAAIVEGGPPVMTAGTITGFAYLSLVGTALAFVLWFNGIRRLPAAAPPLLGLAAPVTGAALGWFVLGQSLSPTQLSGFAITLAAIAYGGCLRPPLDRKPTPSSVTGDLGASRRPVARDSAESCAHWTPAPTRVTSLHLDRSGHPMATTATATRADRGRRIPRNRFWSPAIPRNRSWSPAIPRNRSWSPAIPRNRSWTGTMCSLDEPPRSTMI